jgi:aryl-alcohol dehydrogenase-like predicted oxidoreductase
MTEFVRIGGSELFVSRLGLGTFNFGHEAIGCDEAMSAGIIRAYLDAGHNYIDTANIYGGSLAETYVGTALKGRRDDVVLATKAGGAYGPGPNERGASRKALSRALDDSLRRLQTDYIDLYQMHVYDYETPVEETLTTLNDFVRAGKIRYYGVCNWTAAQIVDAVRLCQIYGWAAPISAQMQYNLLQRDIEVEVIPVCGRFHLAVLPWSPLAGSLLTGKYRARQEPPPGGRLAIFPNMLNRLTPKTYEAIETVVEEAARLGTSPVALSLGWLMQKPGIVAPLIGPETEQQLFENLEALEVSLPPDTVARLDAAMPPATVYPQNFGRGSGPPPGSRT